MATLKMADQEAVISVSRREAHPFLAEYDRTLLIGTRTGRVECALPMDTGGTVRLNVYQAGRSRVFLRDRLGVYLADLDAPSGNCAEVALPADAGFLGAFDELPDGWRFVGATERRELAVDQELTLASQ